jgi:hypothetical protein
LCCLSFHLRILITPLVSSNQQTFEISNLPSGMYMESVALEVGIGIQNNVSGVRLLVRIQRT